ncbi:MAG: MBL fold metallo-hydrolase [Herpetosiphonaceae bacterium]|nr:MAG: MBL fold metallo-hydrolase [Herpetosiphonaceae bacterium]
MRLTILGSGTSFGIPVIGCECAVCASSDPRNQRTRTSALVEVDGVTLLLDAGPDLRIQALRAGLRRLDAVLLTHSHADHTGGIDDLRPFNYVLRRSLPIYGDSRTLADVRQRFAYAFAESSPGSSRPMLDLRPFDGPFEVEGVGVTPLSLMHGSLPITGFRIGDLAYITDASEIPAETRPLLEGLDVLVLNALRYEPHPMHFSLQQALVEIEALKPRRAFLTHLTHAFDHETVERSLPPHVHLAYDGLVVEM